MTNLKCLIVSATSRISNFSCLTLHNSFCDYVIWNVSASMAQNIVWYVSDSPRLIFVSPWRGLSSLFAMSQLLQIYELSINQFEMSHCLSCLQENKFSLSQIVWLFLWLCDLKCLSQHCSKHSLVCLRFSKIILSKSQHSVCYVSATHNIWPLQLQIWNVSLSQLPPG